MNQFQPLPNAIVGVLPLHDYQTRYTTSVAAVALRLKQTPALPGVMVVDGRLVVGVLSRQQLERLKQSEADDPRDLQPWLPALPPILELPDTCPIPIAAERALQRSAETCYEPIVVTFRDGSRRLLAVQELLLAQMQIFGQLYQMSQYQQVHIQGGGTQLRQAQQQLAALQVTEQAAAQQFQACQQQLAQQQGQLQQQRTTLAEWRNRVEQVKEFFSQSRQQTLQSITAAVETISHRTNHMAVIGRSVAQELDHIHAAATLIKKISQQSRFLGLRSAVLASRFGSEAEGLGQVTADFCHLSDQALKMGQQLDETADRVKARLAELAQLAQMGATATHQLVDQATESATTLIELENVLAPSAAADSVLAPTQDLSLLEVRSLKTKAQSVDTALLELEKLVK